MSYSIEFRAASKDEAKTEARNRLHAALDGQQGHVADKALIVSDVLDRIDALPDPKPGESIRVRANGSSTCEWFAGQVQRILGSQSNLEVRLEKT